MANASFINMNRHHFFISPDQIHGGKVTLVGAQARQIYSVLRMRESQQIVVLDNQGWQYAVRLDTVASDLVSGEIVARNQASGEPQTHLTLYQAMLKKDNFEWILQKGTEIGVSRFVPMITQRCVVRQETLKPSKMQRWQRIISEAAEQSGRGRLPVLSAPLTLGEALDDVAVFDHALVPWEGEMENGFVKSMSDYVEQQPAQLARISLFIGPEGGLADDEVQSAAIAGVQPVTLGPRILRAETAAIVASTLALAAMGDLDR